MCNEQNRTHGKMSSTFESRPEEYFPNYRPKLPLLSASKTTTKKSKVCGLCWASAFMCCCLPLCYPCYFSRVKSTRKRLRKSHKFFQGKNFQTASKPGKTGFTTSTMRSEGSTGIRGNGALLSRTDTNQTLLPNINIQKIQDLCFKAATTNRRRKDIVAVFIATDASMIFLQQCQLVELLFKDASLQTINDMCTGDRSNGLLFDDCGYVDVSEGHVAARISVKVESKTSLNYSDSSKLAHIYGRQVANADIIVLMVSKNDMYEFSSKGLFKYVCSYWAGYFPALAVVEDYSKEEEIELDFVASLKYVFQSVHIVNLQCETLRAKVFSSIIRIWNRLGLTSNVD